MLREVQTRFLPRTALIFHPTDPAQAAVIEAVAPFIKEQRPIKDQAAAYVCQNRTCQLPTTDPAKLITLLEIQLK